MIEDKKIQFMIELYNSGKTQKEISEILKCSQTNVSKIFKRRGIKCRDRISVFKNIKYIDINIAFFKEINTEESAYFLGFLYADGCVQIKNNAYTVCLKLKSDDLCIIEKFRDIMSPSSTIKATKNKESDTTYSYFRINQKEICDQLISHGCIPNKSLILEFPKTIPDELIRHFLRGYSDGDGTIYKNRKGINTIWKIISTKQFCEQTAILLKKVLSINCSQSLSRPKTNKITTTLSVGGNLQCIKMLDWLYINSTIYLPRKYDKYIEFKNYISSSKLASVSSITSPSNIPKSESRTSFISSDKLNS